MSELVPPGVTGAVPALPVEHAGSPGCSDVTDCSSDWSTRVAMASTGSLWVARSCGGGGRVGVLLSSAIASLGTVCFNVNKGCFNACFNVKSLKLPTTCQN